MRTAAMNVPFLLQSLRVVPDGQGGSVQQWSTLAAVWGSLDKFTGGDTLRDVQSATHVVVTRNRGDFEISTAHRLAYNGRYFQIRSVTDVDARKRFLRLYVGETTSLN